MFTSATEKHVKTSPLNWRRTAIGYTSACVACVTVDIVYAMFGHGLRSAAMDWMFLCPLVGGAVAAAMSFRNALNSSRRRFRFGYNVFNSGVATITCGLMLRGIMDIALTDSKWIIWFFAIGLSSCALGAWNMARPRRGK